MKKLTELQSTAICGNDITSSCLYVSSLTILYAGQYAWISLLIVALVLFLFRKIYGEVVGALPLNGGAYNVLLNTSSKRVASLAATLTVLSYMATAVLSANESMHYASTLFVNFPVLIATIVVLLIFALLTIGGIGESAIVAVVIFLTHIVSLVLFVVAAGWFVMVNGLDTFHLNWARPPSGGDILMALFFGFSAAMLGISGFESSANFVEEQAPGVFPKTLRNMWGIVSFFNPLIAFLIICIIPISTAAEHNESLLAFVSTLTGGKVLGTIISIDAVFVLCGAVLTSFVGVSGLINRMTLDRVLPNYFLKKNKRGSNYRIIIAFLILCISILLVTLGDMKSLAGVYTFSFLSVMALFGIGNLLLKALRGRLPRPERATVLSVLIAVSFVFIAFYGNYILHTDTFFTFIQYLIPAMILVMIMLNRTRLIKLLVYLLDSIYGRLRTFVVVSNRYLGRIHKQINSQEFVFFTKGDNIANLNKVLRYVEENETTNKLKIVNVKTANEESNDLLRKDLEVLDRAYPNLNLEFIEMVGKFGPELIEELSERWNIPKNFMFIGSPGDRFSFRISELGGVRLIM
ncbi:MAG TPA: APC family permease [Saprospiraceae bacterium]|nr:APC family permease [Saprospiraceae bacterium]